MRAGSFLFSGKWLPTVQTLPETGMGYTVISVTLTDGRRFNQAIVDSGHLIRVRGLPDIPFSENDIAEIKATHDKWDLAEKP
jgi:hypothetical protein